jgi:hypothetical protein
MDNGDIITGCTKFRYLGTIFTTDGRDTKNICHRVKQARKIIGTLNGVLFSDRPKLEDTTNPMTHGDWRLHVQN